MQFKSVLLRLFYLILITAVIINLSSVLPITKAQALNGAGTEANPFQISTVEDLLSLNNYLGPSHSNKYFVLTNNLDLNVAPYNTGTGWPSIGNGANDSTRFSGKFNGNGYTISNLFIDVENEDFIGLFSGLGSNGLISNLNLTNVDVSNSNVSSTPFSYIGTRGLTWALYLM